MHPTHPNIIPVEVSMDGLVAQKAAAHACMSHMEYGSMHTHTEAMAMTQI